MILDKINFFEFFIFFRFSFSLFYGEADGTNRSGPASFHQSLTSSPVDMYDPARDSFTSLPERDEQDVQHDKDDKSVEQEPAKVTDSADKTEQDKPNDQETNVNSDNSNQDTTENNENNVQNDDADRKQNVNENSEKNDHADKNEQSEQKNDKEDSKKHTLSDEQNNKHPLGDEQNSKRSPSDELEPPRKLKKPSRRMGNQERQVEAQRFRQTHGTVEPVRSHYNSRPEVGVKQRQHSPIIALRSFNNFIKSALINLYGLQDAVVLDLGCGKGGDLQKWDKNRVRGWIGVDVAEVSVDQARERFDNLRRKNFWADFCVGDAFGEKVEDIVHPDAFPVDVVSIQFGLHYAWETEERARMLMSNVSRALRKGGRFIGTIPNWEVLMDHISNLKDGQLSWGNSIYRIELASKPPAELKPAYGHEYTFYLEDAVGNVPEYIVPFPSFVELAREYDLELVYQRPFLEMFDEVITDNPALQELSRRMKVIKEDGTIGIAGDEREASGIYLAFAFEKV